MLNPNGSSIGGTLEYHIIDRPGWKIGVIGLAEFAWVSTVNCLDVEDVLFDDYVESSHRLVDMLSKPPFPIITILTQI
jgi:2',3'-cyclic-nucleotide 2'-phosphodiesterase (5'-nucleotidase family)